MTASVNLSNLSAKGNAKGVPTMTASVNLSNLSEKKNANELVIENIEEDTKKPENKGRKNATAAERKDDTYKKIQAEIAAKEEEILGIQRTITMLKDKSMLGQIRRSNAAMEHLARGKGTLITSQEYDTFEKRSRKAGQISGVQRPEHVELLKDIKAMLQARTMTGLPKLEAKEKALREELDALRKKSQGVVNIAVNAFYPPKTVSAAPAASSSASSSVMSPRSTTTPKKVVSGVKQNPPVHNVYRNARKTATNTSGPTPRSRKTSSWMGGTRYRSTRKLKKKTRRLLS